MDVSTVKAHKGVEVVVYEKIPRGQTQMEAALEAHQYGHSWEVRRMMVVGEPRRHRHGWEVEVAQERQMIGSDQTHTITEWVSPRSIVCPWTTFEEVLRLRKAEDRRRREQRAAEQEAESARFERIDAAMTERGLGEVKCLRGEVLLTVDQMEALLGISK